MPARSQELYMEEKWVRMGLNRVRKAGEKGEGPFGPPHAGTGRPFARGVTSMRPPFCRTLTSLHGEMANPAGSVRRYENRVNPARHHGRL